MRFLLLVVSVCMCGVEDYYSGRFNGFHIQTIFHFPSIITMMDDTEVVADKPTETNTNPFAYMIQAI